jgi:hypothetical protein
MQRNDSGIGLVVQPDERISRPLKRRRLADRAVLSCDNIDEGDLFDAGGDSDDAPLQLGRGGDSSSGSETALRIGAGCLSGSDDEVVTLTSVDRQIHETQTHMALSVEPEIDEGDAADPLAWSPGVNLGVTFGRGTAFAAQLVVVLFNFLVNLRFLPNKLLRACVNELPTDRRVSSNKPFIALAASLTRLSPYKLYRFYQDRVTKKDLPLAAINADHSGRDDPEPQRDATLIMDRIVRVALDCHARVAPVDEFKRSLARAQYEGLDIGEKMHEDQVIDVNNDLFLSRVLITSMMQLHDAGESGNTFCLTVLRHQ